MGRKYIDAEDLIKNMEAGCIPIHEKGISGILGDESCIKDYIDKAVRIDLVEETDFRNLQKRFNHLLLSDFIRQFDKVNPKTGKYILNIEEADKIQKTICKKSQIVVRTYPSDRSLTPTTELTNHLEQGYTVVMVNQIGKDLEYILEKIED